MSIPPIQEEAMPGLQEPDGTPHDSIITLLIDRPVSVAERLTLRSLAAVLGAADIGAVLVRRDDGKTAIVSERDITRALADDADPDTIWSADVMSEDLIEADVRDSVLKVAFLMLEKDVRHVVVHEEGEIVGLVTARDVLRVLAEHVLAHRD
jgi:signal-transduction protein with cAMP-binding, CBS, and nucleotidyltransferase domain